MLTTDELARLRELLEEARHWRCTGDAFRCTDGNGCECQLAGRPDPLPKLKSAAVRTLPELLRVYEAVLAAPEGLDGPAFARRKVRLVPLATAKGGEHG